MATATLTKPKSIRGLGVPYGVESLPMGRSHRQFVESFTPGAFRESINRGDEIHFKVEHGKPFSEQRKTYGSTADGRLELRESDKGVHFHLHVPHDDEEAMSLYGRARQGAFDGMSFGFIPEAERWLTPGRRIVDKARLTELSMVKGPAYPQGGFEVRKRLASYFGDASVQWADDIERALIETRSLPAYMRDGAAEQIVKDFLWAARGRLGELQFPEVRQLLAEIVAD